MHWIVPHARMSILRADRGGHDGYPKALVSAPERRNDRGGMAQRTGSSTWVNKAAPFKSLRVTVSTSLALSRST